MKTPDTYRADPSYQLALMQLRSARSQMAAIRWRDPQYRSFMSDKNHLAASTPAQRSLRSERATKLWLSENYRIKQTLSRAGGYSVEQAITPGNQKEA